MKKYPLAMLAAVFLILTIVFAALWQQEKENHADAELLCQSAAASSLERFQSYRDGGHESDYWAAVADFRAFEQAYALLVEGTNRSMDYTFCDEVYGILLLQPKLAQAHIDEIIQVMGILARDVHDPNGSLQMSNLRNIDR